jgi:hypothetical protein
MSHIHRFSHGLGSEVANRLRLPSAPTRRDLRMAAIGKLEAVTVRLARTLLHRDMSDHFRQTSLASCLSRLP